MSKIIYRFHQATDSRVVVVWLIVMCEMGGVWKKEGGRKKYLFSCVE